MATSKYLPIFLFFTLLSSVQIQAIDNQMLEKIPSKTNEQSKQIPFDKETNNNNPMNNPKEQEPNFLPENENNYGLYAHDESVNNLPPSSVSPTNNNNNNNNNNNDNNNYLPFNAKYLPKNYNPVAYVTEPEDFNQDSGYTNTPINNNYEKNRANNYYTAQQQGIKVFDFKNREEDSSPRNNRNYNSYYKGNNGNNNLNNYNNRFMDSSLATNNNYNRFRSRVNRVQPQGMSDTRFLENGRYYYDINSEKYSVHPNENAMAMRNQHNPRMFGNHNANSYNFNNYNDAHVQYQDHNNMP